MATHCILQFLEQRRKPLIERSVRRIRRDHREEGLKNAASAARIRERLEGIIDALVNSLTTCDLGQWQSVIDPFAQDLVQREVPISRIVRSTQILRGQFRKEMTDWFGRDYAELSAALALAEDFFDNFLHEFTRNYEDHASRSLRQAEQRHKSFFHNMVFPAFLASPDGHIQATNPPMQEMLCGMGIDARGMSVEKLLRKAGAGTRDVRRIRQTLEEKGKVDRLPLCIEHPAVGRRHLEVSSAWRRDIDGETVGIQGFFQDITRRVESERLVEEQRRNLEAVFDNAPIGMMFINSRQNIEGFNDEFIRNLGGAQEDIDQLRREIPERSFANSIPEFKPHYRDPEAFEQYARHMLACRERVVSEHQTARGLWVLFVAAPVLRGSHDSGRIVLNQNVTHERELEKLRDDLMHMIVHDLKNPLAAISMANGNIERFLPDETLKKVQSQIDIVKRSSKTMLTMIMNLLDISRLEENRLSLNKRRVHLEKLLRDMKPDLEVSAGSRRLEIPNGGQARSIHADPDILRRSLENLVHNAIKHTSRDGKIRISVRQYQDHTDISVIDDGEGIPVASQKRIFEKFGQAEERRRGRKSDTGLGLTFCKLAVEAHDGSIRLKSQPGQGARFTLRFPR